MNSGDKVIVPSYRSWDEEDQVYMVTDMKHLTGIIENMLDSRVGPRGEPMPGNDPMAFVVLDDPLGIQDTIVCKESLLVKVEK